jgi:hypothetical protein
MSETWAVRGKELDTHSDEDILRNPQHYSIWTWEQCHYPDGSERFNTDFLGRWRSTTEEKP